MIQSIKKSRRSECVGQEVTSCNFLDDDRHFLSRPAPTLLLLFIFIKKAKQSLTYLYVGSSYIIERFSIYRMTVSCKPAIPVIQIFSFLFSLEDLG